LFRAHGVRISGIVSRSGSCGPSHGYSEVLLAFRSVHDRWRLWTSFYRELCAYAEAKGVIHSSFF
jgi:hypothetical protein